MKLSPLSGLAMLLLACDLWTPGLLPGQSTVFSSVPHLVKFSGTLTDSAGHPRSGTVGLIFAIYADSSGGPSLWQELQNVELDSRGKFSAFLGAETPDGMPLSIFATGEPRWLAVQPVGEKEQPRTLLTSVPYALRSADADTLGGLPASAFVKANCGGDRRSTLLPNSPPATTPIPIVARTSTTASASSPGAAPVVQGTLNTIPKFGSSNSLINSQINDVGGIVTARNLETFVFADRFSGGDIGKQINEAIAALGVNGGTVVVPAGTYKANTTVSIRSPNISLVGAGSNASQITYIGAGDFVRVQMPAWGDAHPPTQAGRIEGITIHGSPSGRSGVHLGDVIGAQLDDVVVSGFSGPGGAGIWFDNVTNFTERVQIVRVWADNNTKGIRFTNTGGTASQISFGYERILDLRINVGPNQIGMSVEGGALYHSTITAVINVDRNLSGVAVSITGSGFRGGPGTAVADNLYDLTAECTQCGGLGKFLSIAAGTVFTGSGIVDAYSMTNAIDHAASVYLYGPFLGGAPSVAGMPVYMRGQPLGTNPDVPGAWLNPNFGVGNNWLMGIGNNVFWNGAAWQSRGDGVNNGGSAILGSYGIPDLGFYIVPSTGGKDQTIASSSLGQHEVASLGTQGLSIHGNLNVSGTVSKGAGSFKIDHPLDPSNKYLSHSFVESPDMMNIYNGNVRTNKSGFAVVTLPAYFESLNRDFRYQLTPIGTLAQAIIAREVSHNRFTIKTNKPFVKVSWQVTGIRQDAYANAHRIPVEEPKPERERGHFLHPDLFEAKKSISCGSN